ncbi:hypothetical protein [Rhodovulum euryhalinum]|uniref:Uncharacterized protein n=1 Tax=Rhodovulum euryhalinum TaxID=35805 RepID=A0A4R2KFQ0_9RHOB|nr:hypothetical protein [Rhodovulum euryhalinum]TCO69199.1 hypothetical protein EV655_11732 [Rhodovulum euryhalinum]
MGHRQIATRVLVAGLALGGLGACTAPEPQRAPRELRPVEVVPAAPAPAALWPGGTYPAPAGTAPGVDVGPIPPGPRADAALEDAATAMVTPPAKARLNCVADFTARFRLPATSALLGGQGRTAAGWFVDLGMPGAARVWRCQTDPEGRVVTLTPR